jgi:hypothetical protein
MTDNKLLTVGWAQRELNRMVQQHIEYMASKPHQDYLATLWAEWAARPWHERARITARNWIHYKRIRLGEIIAGREFSDDY